MRIAILSAGVGWHVQDLLRAAGGLGYDAAALDFRRLAAGVAAGPRALAGVDRVLVRTMPPGSLEQVVFRMDALHRLRAAGVPVLNPPAAVEACVDKYLATARLDAAGLLVPPTVACQRADDAQEAFAALGGDVVVKPLFGAEGRGMVRVADPELAFVAVDSGPTAALEVPFNLLKPDLRDLFPEIGRREVGLLACGVLAQGRLGGKLQPDVQFHPLDHRSRWNPEELRRDLEQAGKFGFIAEILEVTPAQAAIAFVLDHPEVASAIVGMRTPEQARENLQAWRLVPFPPQVRDRLAETFEELLRPAGP